MTLRCGTKFGLNFLSDTLVSFIFVTCVESSVAHGVIGTWYVEYVTFRVDIESPM